MPKKPKKKMKRKIKAKSAREMVISRPEKPFLPQQPLTLLQVIANAARDPSVDTAKMKALLDMKNEEERRDAETQYIMAMEAAQSEMPLVLRDTENPQTRSLYAKLENLSRVVDPVIHKHGFSLSYGMAESTIPNHYRITCTVGHKGGYSKEFFYDLPTDDVGLKGNQNKTPLHAVASTTTYARRYLKTLIFDIRIAGIDDDGNRAPSLPITDAQLKTLRAKIAEVGATEEKVCEFAKISKLEEMPAATLGRVMVGLEDRAKKKAAVA